MKTEISAGGIIVRKYARTWQILLMKDMNGSWTFPKGLIEKEEKSVEAAEREIEEEVGLTGLKLIKEVDHIEYWYRRNGLIHKKVYYFLFEFKGSAKIQVQKEEGISEANWFDINETNSVIGYPKTNKQLLEETIKLLDTVK